MPDLSEELDIFVQMLRPGIEVDLNTGDAISRIRPSIRSLRKPDCRAVGPRESVGPYNQPEIGRASLRRPWTQRDELRRLSANLPIEDIDGSCTIERCRWPDARPQPKAVEMLSSHSVWITGAAARQQDRKRDDGGPTNNI